MPSFPPFNEWVATVGKAAVLQPRNLPATWGDGEERGEGKDAAHNGGWRGGAGVGFATRANETDRHSCALGCDVSYEVYPNGTLVANRRQHQYPRRALVRLNFSAAPKGIPTTRQPYTTRGPTGAGDLQRILGTASGKTSHHGVRKRTRRRILHSILPAARSCARVYSFGGTVARWCAPCPCRRHGSRRAQHRLARNPRQLRPRAVLPLPSSHAGRLCFETFGLLAAAARLLRRPNAMPFGLP